MTGRGFAVRRARWLSVVVMVAMAATLVPAAVVSAAPPPGAAVGPTDPANGFPSWYQAADGNRVAPCFDANDPNCVAPGAVPGVFDPALPVVFPTNFPQEAFYAQATSELLTPPSCGTGTGKVFIAIGMEAAFLGAVAPGDQQTFGRIRMTGKGLCPNTLYRFVHPFGEISATTDGNGILKTNSGATSDVGCLVVSPAAPCDFTAALSSPVVNGWLKWDSGAPAGYLGNFAVTHTVTGGTYVPPGDSVPLNGLRVYKGTATTPILQTNLWNVAGKLAGPLVAAPTSVDFGGQAVATTSSPRSVTLTNLDLAGVTVTGATVTNADFAVTNNCPATPLPRDATCQVSLTFTPSILGVETTTLSVTHSGAHSPLTVTVSGTGTRASAATTATATPVSLDFGNQRVNVLSSFQRVTVTNSTGTAPLGVTAVTTTGAASADFQIMNQTCIGVFVAPGSTCSIDVAARTTALGARSAQLSIVSNATGSPNTVGLAANGIGGIAAVSSTILPESGYPTWYQDENGVRLTPCYAGSDPLCIVPPADATWNPALPTNINATPMNIPAESFYSLADSALLATPGCPTAVPPIAPGKAFIRMALEGAFVHGTPAIGDQMAFGRIRAFGDGLCPNTEYAYTNPYGVEHFTTDDAGLIPRNAATQDIGCVPAAPALCDWTLPLQSRLLSGFLRWDPSVLPAAPAGYTGDSITPHRVVGGSYVPPGATAPVDYFRLEQLGGPTPVVIGESNLWLIAGKLAGPVVAVPSPVSLPDATIGASPTTANVDVVNEGSLNVTVTGPITISGANAAEFTVPDTTPCLAHVLAPGAKCTLSISFSPTGTGHRTATLTVNHDSVDSPLIVGLTGLGLAAAGVPAIGLVPATLDFGTQRTGFTSPARTVTINNDGGGAALVIATITASAGFVTANDTCSNQSIAPNASCTVDVAFRPTVAGPATGTLDVHDSQPPNLHQVTLSGTGFVGAAAVSGVDPTTSFPRWYGDDNGLHLGLCLDKADPGCVLPGQEPNYDPTLPVVFPTNFPSASFYAVADSTFIPTDGCPDSTGAFTTTPGTARLRMGIEAAFANGIPLAGDQMTFGRLRFLVDSGLCANTTYSFVHPYGVVQFTTDALGGLPASAGTIAIGCATPNCDFGAALGSDVFRGFLRWDPNVAPLAPAGHLGNGVTPHSVVGGTAGNVFKILRPDGTTVSQTNQFVVAGLIAPEVAVSPTSVAFGNQLITTTSTPQTVTVTNNGLTPMALSSIGVTGADAADFTASGGTCDTTTVLAVGGTCTINVTYSRATLGASLASLQIAYPAAGSPVSVPLSGAVVQSTTTTTLAADFDPTIDGSPVTFTATVASAIPAAGPATGTVQFNIDGADIGGPVAVAAGQATFSTSSLTISGSPHVVIATYGGDVTHAASSSSGLPHSVVAKVGTTVALASSLDPSLFNESVTFTAIVTPQNTGQGTPGGTVQFSVDGTPVDPPVALVGGSASLTVSNLSLGDHLILASYAGSPTFDASLSNNVIQTVSMAVSTTTLARTTGPDPSIVGTTVTWTATVSGPLSVPDGTVQFNVDGVDSGTPVALVGGAASLALSDLAPGAHLIFASYGGNLTYNGSVSTGLSQTVNKAPSTTTLVRTAGLDPSTIGTDVTWTATVSGAVGTPTGTIQFNVDGLASGTPVALVGGAASLTLSNLTAGDHLIFASYNGVLPYDISLSNSVAQTVTKAVSTTTLVRTAGLNPSAFGAAVTWTATVSGAAGTPTGTVQFNVDGVDSGAPVPLVAGAASLTLSNLTPGSHIVFASYGGNATYATSLSNNVVPVVSKVASATALVRTAGPNPSALGTAVTWTATVSGIAGTPAGTVQFTVDGVNSGAPVALVGGAASLTLNNLTTGVRTIRASYAGSATYNTSISANVTQTVGQFTISGVVTSSGGPLAGAVVSAFNATTGLIVTSATTDGTGTYTLTLAQGNYKLRASKLPTYPIQYVGGTSLATATVIPLAGNTTQNIRLLGQYTISGVVSFSGGTLAGAVVSAFNATTGLIVTSATADASGAYTLTLAEGSYKLRASKLPTYPIQYVGGTSLATATVIPLSANTTRNITLLGQYTLSGVVSTSAGPLLGAVVSVFNATTGSVVANVTTTASGAYTFTLTEGTYKLRASKLPAFPITYVGGTSLATATVIPLTGNTVQNMTLLGQYTISGVVGSSGGPLVGAVVSAFNATTGLIVTSATTTAGGAYTLTLAEGSYKVRASKLPTFPITYVGGTSLATATVFGLTANTTLNITLLGQYTLSGVVSASGVALPGAIVSAFNATTGLIVASATTDAAGRYTLTLTEGGYKLRTSKLPTFPIKYVGGTSLTTATVITLTANTTLDIPR